MRQNYPAHQIAIRMDFQDMTDGRVYVTSPDLAGFHALIDRDEDFMEALSEPLRVFIGKYLNAEVTDLRGRSRL